MATCKTCYRCKMLLPIEQFYRHAKMADGRLNQCKSCTIAEVLKARAAKAEYYAEYDRQRAYLPSRQATLKAARARWSEKHPERKAAQQAVTLAIRAGLLQPWPACAVPGCENGPLEFHHADYDCPLDGTWLCQCHHHELHQMTRQLRAAA